MKILFLGDVVGRAGRDAVKSRLPSLKAKLAPDIVIVNVDNAASGRGTTKETSEEMFEAGADCLTGGDHIWDQREMVCVVENNTNIIRPYNQPAGTPGRGIWRQSVKGQEIVVLHLAGTVFMSKTFDNPFLAADAALSLIKREKGRSIFVDFHAEATSEKMALAHYLDGRVSAVIGSHTHIPTADRQILPNGTAFQSDAGMCGDYNSVIGVDPLAPIHNFLQKVPRERMTPAMGEATLCGTLIITDDSSGQAQDIRAVRIGGRLKPDIPEI